MSAARTGMRFASILDEAGRDLTSGTTRATWLLLLAALGSIGLVRLDLDAVLTQLADARRYQERGASITILSSPGGIDGRRCDALSKHDGVRAAGALREEPTEVRLANLPQNPLPHWSSSPGFTTMLPASSGQQLPGLLLPTQLVSTLGLDIGDPVHTSAGRSILGGSYDYPDDGRPPGLGYAVIAPTTAHETFDECWIDVHPANPATRELLYTTIRADAPAGDSPPSLTQHNPSLGQLADTEHAYHERATAHVPYVALLAGLLLGGLAIWARRLELSSALHTGVCKRDLLAIVTMESCAWALPGPALGVPVAAYLAHDLATSDFSTVLLTSITTPSCLSAGALLGTGLVTAFIRERRLFAYFKTR